MNRQELKKIKKMLESSYISLTKFLISYCGLYNEKIHSAKISHQDVKELMPHIKRVSFENLLDNTNDFYMGKVIAVKDCHGNVVPYINPVLESDFQINFDCELEKEDVFEEISITDNMSQYELAELCKKFKEHNMQREYRCAYRKLKEKKGTKVKLYKKKKNELRMEGRFANDKY